MKGAGNAARKTQPSQLEATQGIIKERHIAKELVLRKTHEVSVKHMRKQCQVTAEETQREKKRERRRERERERHKERESKCDVRC